MGDDNFPFYHPYDKSSVLTIIRKDKCTLSNLPIEILQPYPLKLNLNESLITHKKNHEMVDKSKP